MGRGAGAFRLLGVAGGAAGTAWSGANIVSQGNPVDAWQENGAGYAAEWAELGFNASLTSMMIAPNPVSAGLVIGTGIAWAGLEIYHNWDDVTAFAGDAYDAGAAAAGWVADTGGDAVDAVGDTLEDVGDAASDIAGGTVDALGSGASTVAGWLH